MKSCLQERESTNPCIIEILHSIKQGLKKEQKCVILENVYENERLQIQKEGNLWKKYSLKEQN